MENWSIDLWIDIQGSETDLLIDTIVCCEFDNA